MAEELEDGEWRDLAAFRTEYDSDLGIENRGLLLNACLTWIVRYIEVDRRSLKGLLTDETFQQIIKVHEQMKKQGFPSLVPDYIFQFAVCTHHSSLMVPYVYLTGTIPRNFLRVQVGFLEFGSTLPKKMKDLGLLHSSSPEERKQGELLLEKFCSDRDKFQFVCRYCKLTTESFPLSSTEGPLHAVDCPRYLPSDLQKMNLQQ